MAKTTDAKQKNQSLPPPLLRSLITEKSTRLSAATASPVYVFAISPGANKPGVKQAIVKAYDVLPRRIRISRLPSKSIFVRGRRGVRPGLKKAYVYLKKGDKIEINTRK